MDCTGKSHLFKAQVLTCFNCEISNYFLITLICRCMSSVGPRYHAGLSCLLGCVYNRGISVEEGDLEGCEKACNEQFMSLVPLDESWLSSSTTLFSTPNQGIIVSWG